MSEDEVPVNAPKWTTAGYNGSLKASVKYTHRNVTFSPKPLPPTALSTAPVKAGPSRTVDIFSYEDTLVGENILDSDNSTSRNFDRVYHMSIYAKCRSTPKNVDDKNDEGDKEEDDKEDDKDKEEGVKDKEDDKVEDDKAENEEDKRHDKNEEAGDRVVEE